MRNMSNRPTSAFVDLDALARNFQATKEFVGPDPQYLAVVKANAYGHGAGECSVRLESEGVDWFGVALPEEGAEIRSVGVTRPILCFGSFWSGQEDLVVDNNITPVICDSDAAAAFDRV
ncbi:MAG: alanine racemase, partial [Pyrinomonadaceae bacterium]